MGEDRDRVARGDGRPSRARPPRTSTTTSATTLPATSAPGRDRARSSQPGWASGAPRTSVRVATAVSRSRAPATRSGVVGGNGGRERARQLGVDRDGQRDQALDEPRPGPADDDVVGRPDRPGLDRRHRAPAGALGDDLGGRPVGGVAEDDHLGIRRHELLERDAEDGRVPGRDRRPAGQLDHLGDERVVGRTEDVLRRVELVERPRRGQALDRGGDLVEAGPHRGRQVARRRSLADGIADQLDVGEDALDVARHRSRAPGCSPGGAGRSPRAG